MQTSIFNKNNYRLEHPSKHSRISQSTSKQKQSITSPLTPLKLNSNKLPNDFFKKNSKIPPLPPKTKLTKRTKPKAQTYRKDRNKSQQSQNISEFIPEAENTCYFKMQGSLQFDSISISPPHHKYSSSTKYIPQKILQRLGGSDEISLFINNKTERPAHYKDQFLYTFSKQSQDFKNKTPLKQNSSIYNSINTTKTTSKNYLSKEKQSNICQLENISRRYKLRDMGQSKEMKTAKKNSGQKKVNRIYEQIVLPKIHANQRQ